MFTVDRWTGLEAGLLRRALRLSIRDFAARLGVAARTVNKWEARQAGITPLPHMQEVLDTAFARASDEVKARFAAAISTAGIPADRPGPESAPQAPRSEAPVRGAMVPVVVDGRLVLVPVDVGAVSTSGVGAVTVEPTEASDSGEVDRVLRRDFSGSAAAFVLGLGVDALDTDRLATLLGLRPAGSRRLGATDITAIEQVTAAFRGSDFAHGGGLCRDAAVAQLRSVLPLLDAQASPEVRNRLQVAIADLAKLSGWLSYDIEQHDVARRLWLLALDLARDADDPRAPDITIDVLARMAQQAVHLRRPDEAQRLVRLGYPDEVGRLHPASASAMSYLANSQAWACAAQGDAAGCERALGQIMDYCAATDPASASPWAAHRGAAQFAAWQGHAYFILAQSDHDARTAGRAVSLLRHAVQRFGPDQAHSRGLHLAGLSGAHALAGDADTAVTIGHQAVDAISALASPRAHERLRTLNTVLAPLHATPGVAELRNRLPVAA